MDLLFINLNIKKNGINTNNYILTLESLKYNIIVFQSRLDGNLRIPLINPYFPDFCF